MKLIANFAAVAFALAIAPPSMAQNIGGAMSNLGNAANAAMNNVGNAMNNSATPSMSSGGTSTAYVRHNRSRKHSHAGHHRRKSHKRRH
jgi:hypothetical protein